MEKNLLQAKSSVKRIVFVGPECTGKSTLCEHLAKIFNTQFTPEYMRIYLQKKWDNQKESCNWNDLLPIAKGQIELENTQLTQAQQFLFCDTNLFEIMVYAYIYYQKCPELIEKLALNYHKYDFIFLTNIDVPWESDDLRDRPFHRQEIFNIFKNFLTQNHLPFHILSGNISQRISKVTQIITN